MISAAYVNLWGERVGAIAWDNQTGLSSFEYEAKFLRNNLDISPIMMPISKASKRIFSFTETKNTATFKGLPGLLADMLPDNYGNALINAWLSSNGRAANSFNPVELLCFVGTRALGALEIEPALQKESNRASKLELDSLIEVADKILNNKYQFQTSLMENEEKAFTDIIKIGSSAGGARAKAIVAFNKKTREIRSGQTAAPKDFSYWIIKFDGVTDNQFGISKGFGRVEMAYYLMASDSGIEMSTCELLEENERAHFITKRFDRTDAGEKIHMQSFCALRHFDFNNVGFYSYEQLFETLRILGLPYPDAEQLFRRMVFNVLARNCDDHTKNFAFLMDKSGKWKLSPAYDVCFAYRSDSFCVSNQSLTINGKRQNFEDSDFITVAKQMNIKKSKSIIEEIKDVVKKWQNYAETAKVDVKLRESISKNLLV